MKYYHIDAFTEEAFKGNSAGVVLCEGEDLDDGVKQRLAAELRHSETAFVLLRGKDVFLRWFTPIREVDLCGHATVASASALWDSGLIGEDETIRFSTRSGILTARKERGFIELDFPRLFVSPCEQSEAVNRGLGITPIYCAKNDRRYLLEIDSPEDLRGLKPDFAELAKADLGAFMVTCRSDRPGIDFLSRFFAPAVGISEDPVTGSSHCYLAPYWSAKLGKTTVTGFQESERTGIIQCELSGNDRVKLRGKARRLFDAKLEL